MSRKIAINLLSMLAAMKIHYHLLHFSCKGPAFYSLHKMYQKIYESVDSDFDNLGERITLIFGPAEESEIATSVFSWLSKWSQINMPDRIIAPERDFQAVAKSLFDSSNSEGMLTLGLNDLIMSMCNDREKYLGMLNLTLS